MANSTMETPNKITRKNTETLTIGQTYTMKSDGYVQIYNNAESTSAIIKDVNGTQVGAISSDQQYGVNSCFVRCGMKVYANQKSNTDSSISINELG